MKGDSGVAGEGRVVGVSVFHSWGKCTMPLTNINSDWMSNASSGLYYLRRSFNPLYTEFHFLKAAYSARNGAHKKAEEPYLRPFVSKGDKCSSQCQPGLFYSQPRQLPCAWHPALKPTHLPLSHLFCKRKTYLQNGLRCQRDE